MSQGALQYLADTAEGLLTAKQSPLDCLSYDHSIQLPLICKDLLAGKQLTSCLYLEPDIARPTLAPKMLLKTCNATSINQLLYLALATRSDLAINQKPHHHHSHGCKLCHHDR